MERIVNRVAARLNFRRILPTISIALLLPGLTTFSSAAEGNKTIQIKLYPEGQHTNPVVLLVSGERYQDKPLIPVPLKQYPEMPGDIKFLSKLISTNANGSVEDVLHLWAPQERESVRKMASDPTLFEGNRNFYRRIIASRLLATIYYGSYEILFVQHTIQKRTMVKDYPVKRVNGVLVNTNALQADPVFVYLSTKYAKMLQEGINENK